MSTELNVSRHATDACTDDQSIDVNEHVIDYFSWSRLICFDYLPVTYSTS